jgi:hypothetical protein
MHRIVWVFVIELAGAAACGAADSGVPIQPGFPRRQRYRRQPDRSYGRPRWTNSSRPPAKSAPAAPC